MYQLNQSKNAVVAAFKKEDKKKIETNLSENLKSINPVASMNSKTENNNSHKIDLNSPEKVKSILPVADMNTTTENNNSHKIDLHNQEEVNTTTNKPEKKYIYMCSWFETKRHRISHTNMYFEKAEDTNWIFDTPEWFLDLVRIEYICVMSNTKEYSMAQNSK